jgi:TetR/AcrR family transcriptional regulator, repressor for neighboring sulfatase
MNKVGQNKIAAKETAVRSNSHGEIPYGREAVKKAILDAAENLLVKKSAGEISVREIAEAANIKHPLIYRHFGTKEEVIRAAHARGIEKVERVVTKIDNLQGNAGFIFEAVKQNRFRQIALSRAMIDGVDLRLVQTQFPVMQHLLELLEKRKEESESNFDPQIMTAVLAALSLGWFLYEPFLLAATEMEEKNKDEIQQKVVDILEEIIQKLC